MSQITTTSQQAIRNILRFASELEASADLQDRLSYARAWYAHRAADGTWKFGPSKFIGYQNMTAAEYLDDNPRDGRRTEKQLAQWFSEVPAGSDLYQDLNDQLVAFLAIYGKLPSTKIRISVPAELLSELEEAQPHALEEHVVDLIIAVAKYLPPGALKRLRQTL